MLKDKKNFNEVFFISRFNSAESLIGFIFTVLKKDVSIKEK